MAEHGAYNGWCRVEGIPLRARDCHDCLIAMARAAAAALDDAGVALMNEHLGDEAMRCAEAASDLREVLPESG